MVWEVVWARGGRRGRLAGEGSLTLTSLSRTVFWAAGLSWAAVLFWAADGLVNLVEEERRISHAYFLQALDNKAGHGRDKGAPEIACRMSALLAPES